MTKLIWLLYGGKGWIGKHFCSYINENEITLIHGKARCDHEKEIENDILLYKPDNVISLVGRISGTGFSTIDYLEQPGKLKENLQDNLFSHLCVQKICEKHQIHFTMLGTGCIFYNDMNHETVYTPEDDPNFFGSSYSTVKGFVDRYMRMCNNVLNVRIRMPITNELETKNLLYKILHYPKVCITNKNSMTVLSDLLPVMITSIKNKQVGTIHLVNPGPMTHSEILNLYKEIVDPEYVYITMSEEEQNKMLMAKRSVCVLSDTFENIPTLRDSIISIFNEWKQKNIRAQK